MPEESVSIVAILKDKFSEGFKTLHEKFEGIKKDIERVKGVIEPFTGRFAEFVVGFASIEGIKKAIEQAKVAEETATRLKSALGANVDRFQEISDLATEIAEKSTFTGGEVKKLTTSLLERGVAVADLQKTIAATVETTAALGGDLVTRGQEIARTFQGVVPRELSFAVGELKSLDEQALRAGKAVDLLGVKFAGRAAALANTDLGRIKQNEEKIEHAFVSLGKVFIKLEAIILPALAHGIEQLAKDLSDNAPVSFLKLLAVAVTKLIEHLPEVVEFWLALKAFSLLGPVFTLLGAAVSILAGTISLLLSPVGIITAGVVALTAAVIAQIGGWKKLGDTTKGSLHDVQAIWEALKKGDITIEDLVDFIVASTKAVFRAFKGYVYDPIKLLFAQLIEFAILSFDQLVAISKSVGIHVAKFVGDTFLGVVRLIAEAIDGVTNAAADALSKLPSDTAKKISQEIRTNLAATVPAAVLEQATHDVDAQLKRADQSMKTFIGGIKDEWVDTFKSVGEDIDGFFKEADDKAATRKKQRDKEADDAAKKEKDRQSQLLQQQQSSLQALADNRIKITEHKTEELAKEENALQLAQIEQQFKFRRIALEDYLQQKQDLEQADFKREIGNIDETVAALKQKLVGTKGDVNVEVRINELLSQRELLQIKLRELQVQQLDDANTIVDKETARTRLFQTQIDQRRAATSTDPSVKAAAEQRKLEADQLEELFKLVQEGANAQEVASTLDVQGLEKVAAARERVNKLATDYLNKVNEQQTFLSTKVKETSQLLELGQINQQEADRRNAVAFDQFKASADLAIAKLREVEATATDPEVRARIENQITELGNSVRDMAVQTQSSAVTLAKTLQEDTQKSFGDFFGSILKGTKTVRNAFADLIGNIGNMFLELVASAAAKKFVQLLSGGTPGGGIFGSIGSFFKFAEGGLVPGGGPPVDSVSAMLTPGEFVARQQAVQHYGVDFFEAANRMMIPRDIAARFRSSGNARIGHFAGGGVVHQDVFGNASGVQRATVVADEQAFDALLAGGHSAMLRFFGQNKETIAGLLGIR